ncbi:MAG: alpha/beta fold hydrolase, partial [Steroidobacteraceae bacterium]
MPEDAATRSPTLEPVFYDDSTRRTLNIDGSQVHFHDVGAGEPLLMLQPFGPLPGTTAWLAFHRVIGAFAERFRCVLVDNANFGLSSPVRFDEPVHDLYVRQALGVLDGLEIDTTRVLGTSTGGTVALDLALTAPERVTQLVIGSCEASTGGDPYLLAPTPSEVYRLFHDCQSSPPDRERIRRLLQGIVYDTGLISDPLVDALYAWRVSEPDHADAWSQSTSVPHSNIAALAAI